MGRLKQDHSGYRTSGIWLKYQQPRIEEKPFKSKSKKNTNKWCKGKVGREHDWHRFEKMRWSWGEEDYVDPYIAIHCVVCDKQKYTKTAKSANYPLHIFIKEEDCGVDPIQIKVNGDYKPLTLFDFKDGKYFCHDCGFCH